MKKKRKDMQRGEREREREKEKERERERERERDLIYNLITTLQVKLSGSAFVFICDGTHRQTQ